MRRVPRRQRARRVLIGTEPVGMSHLRGDAGGRRGPVAAGESCHQRAVGERSREDVVLDGRRRSGPLTVDPLPAFVDEHRRVASARVQFVDVCRHRDACCVDPWSGADTRARIRRVVAVVGVSLDAQIRAPCFRSGADGGRQALTQRVGTAKAAETAGGIRGARDEEAQRVRRAGSRRWRAAAAAGRDDGGRGDCKHSVARHEIVHVRSSAKQDGQIVTPSRRPAANGNRAIS